MSANDAGFKAIRDSFGFFLNSNFTHSGVVYSNGEALGTKNPTIDEFIHILPFDEYDSEFLDSIAPSQARREVTTDAYLPAFLPGGSTNNSSGAHWIDPAFGTTLSDHIEVEVAGNPSSLTTIEQPTIRRLGVLVEFDKLLASSNRLKAGLSIGPDASQELLRAGRVMLLRELCRVAINGSDGPPTVYSINGLHNLYNETFGIGATPDDRQVFESNVSFPTHPAPVTIAEAEPFLAEVQQLIRLVSPSEDGFGAGANVLLTSWRARDLLVRCERVMGAAPQFLPDPRSGKLRYHFDGVPVYVGPVREDENPAGPGPSFAGGTNLTYTSIYALRLGGMTGLRMLHYGGTSEDHGVQVEELREQTQNVMRGYRLTGYYALFMPERQAGARLWKVDVQQQP